MAKDASRGNQNSFYNFETKTSKVFLFFHLVLIDTSFDVSRTFRLIWRAA